VATALVVFLAVPGAIVLALGLASRRLGLVVACLFPFLWTILAWEPTDALAIWLVPAAAACAVALTARVADRPTARRAAAWGGVALAALVLLAPGPSRPTGGVRVVLIGIDGGTWGSIDPLLDAGRMPNLAGLIARGRRADLRSLPSMFSPQVWSSIATGCDPQTHGIANFQKSQADFQVGRIWDQVGAEDRTYGVCGWYFTWPPPEDLDPSSFVIPSTLAPDGQTVPPGYGFIKELWTVEKGIAGGPAVYVTSGRQAFRGGVALSTLRRGAAHLAARRTAGLTPRDKTWRARRLGMAFQTDVFVTLLRERRPEFAAILLNQLDQVSHRFWKYAHPEPFPLVKPDEVARYGGAVDGLYIEFDRSLGKILEAVPDDCNVVVVSDHGFRAATTNTAGRSCRIRTENLIDLMGLSGALSGANVDRAVLLHAVETTGEGAVEPLRQAARLLEAARIEGDERRLFDVVDEGDCVKLTMAPRDAVPEQSRVVLGDRDYAFKDIFITKGPAFFSGVHGPDGIYVCAGPMADVAIDADSLNVLDVAPTVAALLDLPASPDWQGRPALEPGSYRFTRVAAYPPPSSSPEDGAPVDETLKEKLRALGYLE
jgi:hypothetical protein